MRQEKDSIGIIDVEEHVYWGAQTERSRRNFTIGTDLMPFELIEALAIIKKCAALANYTLGVLPKDKSDLIRTISDEVISGKLKEHFPLRVWQTGSGTQTNMNVNEVISNRAIESVGGKMGSKTPIHPNDDVNKSQSTNDVFPSAIHIATAKKLVEELLPTLEKFQNVLDEKSRSFLDIIKVGRTHCMDAAPLSLGQEFSAFAVQIQHDIEAIQATLPHLYQLAIGGTAVGTGLNAPKGFGELVASLVEQETHLPFVSAPNKFEALSCRDAIVFVSGALKRCAVSLFKIANDIRLLGSGPRAGFNELHLPENEPGSSIMPGKVNPTQCEAMTMVAAEVMGADTAITFAGASGHFQLNVFMPLIGYNILRSIRLLTDGVRSFTDNCVVGIEPNRERIAYLLEQSLMLATALNPIVGYDKAAEIVKKAHHENLSLKEAAKQLGILSEEEFNRYIDPKKMVFPS